MFEDTNLLVDSSRRYANNNSKNCTSLFVVGGGADELGEADRATSSAVRA